MVTNLTKTSCSGLENYGKFWRYLALIQLRKISQFFLVVAFCQQSDRRFIAIIQGLIITQSHIDFPDKRHNMPRRCYLCDEGGGEGCFRFLKDRGNMSDWMESLNLLEVPPEYARICVGH